MRKREGAYGVGMNAAETRAKLIDPAIHARGWTEDLIKREESAGAIEIADGTPRRRGRGRIDYLIRLKVNPDTQPVAVALIEAKAEDLPPTHGLEQATGYADPSRRFHVPFSYSTNGHLFVESDDFTKRMSTPRPLADFPLPADLRERYEAGKGFSLAEARFRIRIPYTTACQFNLRMVDKTALIASPSVPGESGIAPTPVTTDSGTVRSIGKLPPLSLK